MCSDKRNLMMAIAIGLISSLFNITSSRDVRFHPAAAPLLASWFYHCSPLFSFVFHSFLPYCAGDDLQFVCDGFGVRLAVLAGALVMLFFTWNGSQTVEDLEAKRSVMIYHVK